MSENLKHIPSKSMANLDRYMDRDRDGNDRAVYSWGQHCTTTNAAAQFRQLRQQHGTDGQMRKAQGKYEEPDDPADATHIKIGKNWREAKAHETATHVRIPPPSEYVKATEVYHGIISFPLSEVNPEDPAQCRAAFEAVTHMLAEDYSGLQMKAVAHGDARGSKDAQERREGGKFHIHVAFNATVHSEFTVGGVTFMPGQKMAKTLTNVDHMRDRKDRWIEQHGAQYGLSKQKMPAVGSPEYNAARHTDHDFWTRERGGISDQDLTREAVENALGNLSKDDVAGLSVPDRKRLLKDTLHATSGITMKLTKAGKLRSYNVPGRKKPITRTELGQRYQNDGLDQQLDDVAQGRFKPYQRYQDGPPKQIPKLEIAEFDQLQRQADAWARDELVRQ